MKTRHIVILLGVLLALGVIFWISNSREKSTWKKETPSQTLLPAQFDADAVKSIHVTKNGQRLTFQRSKQGWMLLERSEYPVDTSQLGKIVFDLMETKVAQTIHADANDLSALELTDEAGAVELKLLDANDRCLALFRFGKRVEKEADQATNAALHGQAAGLPLGRYVLLQDGNAVFVANTFSILDNTPGQWLNQDFISIDKIKSISLSVGKKMLWKLERKNENDALEIVGDIPEGFLPDANAIGAIDRSFKQMRFLDVTLPTQQIQFRKTLNISDWNGTEYVIDFSERNGDGRYIRIKASHNGEGKAKYTERISRLFDKYCYLIKSNAFDAVDRVHLVRMIND